MKRTTTKSIAKVILGIIAAIALIASVGETNSPALQLPWTIGCMGIVAIVAKVMERFNLFEEER